MGFVGATEAGELSDGRRNTSSRLRISFAAAAVGGGGGGGGGETMLFRPVTVALIGEAGSAPVGLSSAADRFAVLVDAGAGPGAAVTTVVAEPAAADPLRNALVTSYKELEADAVTPKSVNAAAALIGCISRKAGRRQLESAQKPVTHTHTQHRAQLSSSQE